MSPENWKERISHIVLAIEEIQSFTHGMDFKADKSNHKYIELGGSNKFVTFKLWYKSHATGDEKFIKIQFNAA